MQYIITEKKSNQINILWWNEEKIPDSETAIAKENLKFSYGWPSQIRAWNTSPQM